MKQNTFSQLKLAQPIARALAEERYDLPTPIQAAAIPPLLKGSDLIGCAQTGTGKTAAFALPILHNLITQSKRPMPGSARVLVLTPTRELSAQVGESFKTYGRHLKLSHSLVFGGVGQNPQVKSLRRGADICVATPGRLLDLMNQNLANLKSVEVFVLDEADRMLDMGFLRDIKKIIAELPKKRQTLLFSATMAPQILKLAEGLLNRPVKVSVTPPASTTDRIEERVLFVKEGQKPKLLSSMLKSRDVQRALVFTRTKHGANRLVTQLGMSEIDAVAIHGNKSQTARTNALKAFKEGKCYVLVATDIAARGIDVDGISHVFNFDLPNEPESYVHRIGRTARSGATGTAVSFCGSTEQIYLRDIERLLKRRVPVDKDFPCKHPPQGKSKPIIRPNKRRFRGNRNGSARRG